MLRKTFFIQIIKFSFLIFCAASFSFAQKTVVDKNSLTKFEKSIEQGDYSSIERDLLNYVIQNPSDAKAFELLARIRFTQNRLNEARSLYQKVLSLDPNATSAKINLAAINFQTGNSEQAVSDLNQITDKEIYEDSIRLQLAQTFALVGDCQRALVTIEKLNIKIKNSDALPLRAKCYFENGEKSKIETLLPTARTIVKQSPETSVKFSEVLINAEMFKQSADVLNSVVKSFPQNADALVLLAKSEVYLKDFPNAKLHLNQAEKIKADSPELFFVRSLLESEQGNSAEALELIEKSLAEKPDSTTVLIQYVITAIRANQPKRAVQATEKLLSLKPDEPEFLYLHGAASLQNNNLSAAENSLTRFMELRPKDSRGCLALGLTYAAQTDKLNAARKQLEKCVEINPNNYEAKYQLGLSYKTQGETVKAIEYFEDTVKISPDYALALRDLGSVYLQAGEEAKARTVLEKSVALDANDAETHFQLSRLYNLIGENELAKKHLELFQKLRTPKQNGM